VASLKISNMALISATPAKT